MSAQAIKATVQQVKPLLSLDRGDCRRRVLTLYKAWYRQLPHIVRQYDINKSTDQCKIKLREEFAKHRELTDIRVIDMLIIKGQMELQETVNIWKQKGHVMDWFRETWEPKPTDFLSKFLSGTN